FLEERRQHDPPLRGEPLGCSRAARTAVPPEPRHSGGSRRRVSRERCAAYTVASASAYRCLASGPPARRSPVSRPRGLPGLGCLSHPRRPLAPHLDGVTTPPPPPLRRVGS